MTIQEILNKTLERSRVNFEEVYSSIAALQQKAESATENSLKSAGFLPEESKTAVLNWLELGQESRVKFKEQVLTGHENIGKILGLV